MIRRRARFMGTWPIYVHKRKKSAVRTTQHVSAQSAAFVKKSNQLHNKFAKAPKTEQFWLKLNKPKLNKTFM